MPTFENDPTRSAQDKHTITEPPIAASYRSIDGSSISADPILAEFQPILCSAFARLDAIKDPTLRVTQWAYELRSVVRELNGVLLRLGGDAENLSDNPATMKNIYDFVFLGCRTPPETLFLSPETNQLVRIPQEDTALERHLRTNLENLLVHVSCMSAIPRAEEGPLETLKQYASQFGIIETEDKPMEAIQSLLTRASLFVAKGRLSVVPLQTALASENKAQKAEALVAIGSVVEAALSLAELPKMTPLLGDALTLVMRDATLALQSEVFRRTERSLDSETLIHVMTQFGFNATPLALNMISTGCSTLDPSAALGEGLALEGITVISRLIARNIDRSLPGESMQLCNEAGLPQMLEAFALSDNSLLRRASKELLDQIACG
jgi:hypothetical protein